MKLLDGETQHTDERDIDKSKMLLTFDRLLNPIGNHKEMKTQTRTSKCDMKDQEKTNFSPQQQ